MKDTDLQFDESEENDARKPNQHASNAAFEKWIQEGTKHAPDRVVLFFQKCQHEK